LGFWWSSSKGFLPLSLLAEAMVPLKPRTSPDKNRSKRKHDEKTIYGPLMVLARFAAPISNSVDDFLWCAFCFIRCYPFHTICILFFTCIGRIWLYFGAMIALAGAEKRKKQNWMNY
jgi:hypothetical protein